MIYLYAVTEAGAGAPDCPGLEDEPLEVLEQAGLAGLHSAHAHADFAPEPASLWRHDTVVETAMHRGPVLPARFGTTFGDTASMAAALDRDRDRLRRQLDAVRGCVELAVRVSLPVSATATPSGGSEYLLSKLTRVQEQQSAVRQTLDPLAARAVRARKFPAGSEGGDLTASYLVRTEDVEGFAAAVRMLSGRHCELSLSCTGPWPPYSFVGEEG